MDRAYAIDVTTVVSDIIDGEAVMLHRVSGDYFSTDGVGCLIWQWIGEGQSRSWIIETLNARYAAEQAEIATAVDAFLADLLAHELVREIAVGVELVPEADLIERQADSKAGFVLPLLHVYSDIRKLMLLDPIHEVEKTGWPAPKLTDDPT